MNVVQAEAAPFFYKGGKVGCLLIHGFTGAPAEMRWLGEQLARHDYSALGVRLFAHGTHHQDMLRAKWRDWYLSALDGYHLLKGHCDQIFVIGLSMGGDISLLLGGHYPVSGIVALSTPYIVPRPLIRPLIPIIPLVSKVWPFKSKGDPDWVDAQAGEDHFDYPAYPLIGVYELKQLLKEMRMLLPSISAPTLLLHSKTDGSVPVDHPKRIYEELGTTDKQLIWLENSGHVITRDAEKDRVLEEIIQFISRHSASG